MSFQIARNPRPQYVTALPSSAFDGQEIYFEASATNGVIWHLRYRSAGSATYPWEFVGGGTLSAEEASSSSRTAVGGYQDPSTGTAGPSLVLPTKGEFLVEIGYEVFSVTNGGYGLMSYDIGTTAAVDGDSVVLQQPGAANAVIAGVSSRRKKTISSAVTLACKYKSITGTTTFSKRFINVTPIRVG